MQVIKKWLFLQVRDRVVSLILETLESTHIANGRTNVYISAEAKLQEEIVYIKLRLAELEKEHENTTT